MYIPKLFRESDPEVLLELIQSHGFATLMTGTARDAMVSHVPLLVDRGIDGQARLLGHIARANKHWHHFDGQTPVLAIFHGPHAYISPAWYATEPSVPTWNYAVVHAHGTARTVDADATWGILQRMIEQYEASRENRWPAELPADYVEELLRAIVGFEISIERLEGKFKLSQNREPADREGALVGLEQAPDRANQELAAFSRWYFARRDGG